MARRHRHDRGAALLVAITAIAILTAIGVDLAYNARVELQIAADGRDELRANCLARSAVGLSRLVLHFQHQLDQAGSLPLPIQGASLPQISIRLWEALPVDSSTVALLLAGEPERGREPAPRPARAPADREAGGLFAGAQQATLGDYEGGFRAVVDDEDRKINLPQLAGIGSGPSAQLLRFLELTRDHRWDFLFDREDESGNRFSRKDVAIAIKDWVDEDEVTSALSANPAMPFEPAFGDENAIYDRGPDRYRAKNARFDSLDELFLVGGVSDALMSAFGDRLTVYPDVNAPIDVNTADPGEMMINVLAMAQPPGLPQPVMLDPNFPQKLQAALQLIRPVPFLSISVHQFAQVLTALGVVLQPVYLQALNTDARGAFGSRASTFRIHAIGSAGGVSKVLDVIVTFDSRAGPLASDLGRVLHWREE
jgi:general secretion pathway protein K